MARMIPSTIHPHVRSGAERKLFEVFRNAPGTEDWVCLHSLGLARHATKRRGEIDFLLLSRHGIFVLEVKGGRISRENGIWRFADRYGEIHEKHESPFDQAASAMFALEKEVSDEFQSDERRSRLRFGFGVMFPDVVFDASGVEADQRQVYDSRDRRLPIAEFVNRLAAFSRDRDPRLRHAPTSKDIEAIVGYLRGDFDLVPSLGVLADSAAEQLLSLEREQYAVLDALEQFPKPRMLVHGGAGTGKTLLAIEAAKREARKGQGEVLFVCYNRLLASFLDSKFRSEHSQGSRVVVKSIYGLINELISASSLADDFQQKRKTADQDSIYRQLFPEYGQLAAMDVSATPFHMLVVDEAQDMMTEGLLDVLDGFIDGGFESGRWWMFCDVNNQAAVFGAFEAPAMCRLERFGNVTVLSTNRRNTKQIAAETVMLTRPRVSAPAVVEGVSVKYAWYKSDSDQPVALSRLLSRLLSDGVTASKITVLTPRRLDQACPIGDSGPELLPITTENVCEVASGKSKYVTRCTVSSFKGLENDFIVLTDIENLEADWWRSVIYVGMSRARVGLVVLLKESLRPIYDECLQAWMREHTSTDD